ncbi:bacteriohemerythrin [Shewanella sp. JM162201]|uniref:Bacteriohemerythrin n=1 Tax=Shewanella jiangmenensis TaxID=2837387 RepID=A0ABS5V328_9GAMM|nr:bacteriohemerythrin [Shewanella jiangmenensis]MBT1444221.1 bacteriohemerythrin [Shewanella jiangmenensis]
MSSVLEHKAVYGVAGLLGAAVLLSLVLHAQWLESALLLLSMALTFAALRQHQASIRQLERDAGLLGDGDLAHRVAVERCGQLAQTARGLSRMSEDVGRTVAALMDTSESMHLVAAELKTVSDLTAKGVASQEERTENAAQSMAQLVHTVHDISANAARVASAVDEAKSRATQGGEVVAEAVSRINAMTEQISRSEEVIERLAADAASIGSIIDTISQVAEQTNLLALNAAIESARAGEHGRGFAVVADEVRNLAKRTSEATVEIQQQIQALQAGSRESVSVMKASVTLAEETRELVSGVSEALDVIVTQVAEVTQMSHQIAEASGHQQQVAEQINDSIASISQQAADNAHNTNRNNLASLKLFNMSQEIGSLLHRFNIDRRQLKEAKEFVSWSSSLDVGMSEINRQHQRLISLINELHRAMEGQYGLDVIKRIVQGLVDYTANHFSYEEELFARFGYPHSKEHKDEHARLVTQVLDFQKRVARGEDVSDELMSFLKAWLIDHIQGSDRGYSQFLLQKGAD